MLQKLQYELIFNLLYLIHKTTIYNQMQIVTPNIFSRLRSYESVLQLLEYVQRWRRKPFDFDIINLFLCKTRKIDVSEKIEFMSYPCK